MLAATPLVGGTALAATKFALFVRAPATVSVGKPERIVIGGVTTDAYDELVVYQGAPGCEKNNDAQAKHPYAERLTYKPVSQSRTPGGNPFVVTITIKHEAKGEQRVCAFLIGTDRFTVGRTAADASGTYQVT
jgi:hypothetical protein